MVVANDQLTESRLQRLTATDAANGTHNRAHVESVIERRDDSTGIGLLPPLFAQLAASGAVVVWLALTMPSLLAAAYSALLLLVAAVTRVLTERRITSGATTERGGQTAIVVTSIIAFGVSGLLGQTIITPVAFILPAAVWLLAAVALGRPLADIGSVLAVAAGAGMTLLSLSGAAALDLERDALLMLGLVELAAIGAARWHGARSGALLLHVATTTAPDAHASGVQAILVQARADIVHSHDPVVLARIGVRAIADAFAPSYVSIVEIADGNLVVPLIEQARLSEELDLGRKLVGLTQRTMSVAEPFWMLIDGTRTDDTLTLRRMGIEGLLIVPLEHLGQPIGAFQIAWERLPGATALSETLTFATELGRCLTPDLAITRHIQQIERGYFDAIASLSATMDERDEYMRGHSRRVAKYAVWVADQLGLDEYQQRMLLHAAELHEIGRTNVSDELLSRAGALSDDEWETIRRIPVFSAEIVEPLSFYTDVRSVILYMNERWDGQGGPDGLAGQQIPRLARILAIVDAFDAMTSRRPYREPLAVRAALVQLWNERGSKFDPEIVELFVMHGWADPHGRSIIQ